MFYYPVFDENGKKVLSDRSGETKDMLMDIAVYQMRAGQTKSFFCETDETAVLLVAGQVISDKEGSTPAAE